MLACVHVCARERHPPLHKPRSELLSRPLIATLPGRGREAQRVEKAGKLAFFFQAEAMNKFRPYEAASGLKKKRQDAKVPVIPVR